MGIQRMSNDKLASLQRIDRSLLARLSGPIRRLYFRLACHWLAIYNQLLNVAFCYTAHPTCSRHQCSRIEAMKSRARASSDCPSQKIASLRTTGLRFLRA